MKKLGIEMSIFPPNVVPLQSILRVAHEKSAMQEFDTLCIYGT